MSPMLIPIGALTYAVLWNTDGSAVVLGHGELRVWWDRHRRHAPVRIRDCVERQRCLGNGLAEAR